jgi:hypothetical protein
MMLINFASVLTLASWGLYPTPCDKSVVVYMSVYRPEPCLKICFFFAVVIFVSLYCNNEKSIDNRET